METVFYSGSPAALRSQIKRCCFECDSVGVEMGRVEKSALVPRWQALITAVSPA